MREKVKEVVTTLRYDGQGYPGRLSEDKIKQHLN